MPNVKMLEFMNVFEKKFYKRDRVIIYLLKITYRKLYVLVRHSHCVCHDRYYWILCGLFKFVETMTHMSCEYL